ncbi:MAG: response regulator [Planctomycetota bacterium]
MRADRVLLVDDETEFVETLAERMRTRGLTARTAHSGSDALESVAKTTFDAIVLDLAMPGMDGIETLRLLREADPNLQIMLLSGQATARVAAEAMKEGAIDVLEKPADIEVLINKIKEARANKIMLTEAESREHVDDILKRKGW